MARFRTWMQYRATTLICTCSLVLTACAGMAETSAPTTLPTIVPSTTSTPSPAATSTPDEAAILAGIQKTLDLYAKAYNENDIELLRQTIDQTNRPFRRLVEERFKQDQQSFKRGSFSHHYQVRSLRHREYGFVQVHIANQDSEVADRLFRNINGKWLLSEPTIEQIGERKTVESEHFIFFTYPWADDVTPSLIKLMEQAYNTVKERLGKVEEAKAKVSIEPIYGLRPFTVPRATAYYENTGEGEIVIFAPHSFSFPFYDPKGGWEELLQVILTHEYTHMVTDHKFVPLSRISSWMSEGIAEYVANSPRLDEVAPALKKGYIIPIIDTQNLHNPQDLEHLTLLEKDIVLAYGFSQALVIYITDNYGGLDGFWKLVYAYDKSQNLENALQEAFGVSYQEFDNDWRTWLASKYSS